MVKDRRAKPDRFDRPIIVGWITVTSDNHILARCQDRESKDIIAANIITWPEQSFSTRFLSVVGTMEIQKGCKRAFLFCSYDDDASGFLGRVHIVTPRCHCYSLRAPGSSGRSKWEEHEEGGKVGYIASRFNQENGCLAPQQTHFALGENKLAETQSPKSRSGYSLKCRLTGHN